MRIIIILLFVVTNLFYVVAGDIETKDLKLFRDKANIGLSFSVYVPENTVRTNRRMLVTPQLYNDNGMVSMTPFTVTGKQMEKREKQKRRLNKNDSTSSFVNTTNGSSMFYVTSTLYERWMSNTLFLRLLIKEEGCCSEEDPGVIMVMGSLNLSLPHSPSLPEAQLIPSQVTQTAGEYPFLRLIDKDGEGGDRSTSVRFRGSDYNIDLLFSSNAEHVEKIKEGIRLVNSDKQTRLEKITIAGFASPEGNQQRNLELSENRAKALCQHLQQEMNLPVSIFEIQSGGEDWMGLLELVKKSDMEYKEDIINIITKQPAEKRKSLLQQLAGGRPYKSMYDVFYPQLRDACYINVWYSEKEDETANIINSAIRLISTMRYDEALKHLFAIEQDPRSWNAIGSCYILQGNYTQARVWLKKAIEAGDKEAEKNLNLIN